MMVRAKAPVLQSLICRCTVVPLVMVPKAMERPLNQPPLPSEIESAATGGFPAEPVNRISAAPLLVVRVRSDPQDPTAVAVNVTGMLIEAPAARVEPTAGKPEAVKPLPTVVVD